MPRQRPGGSLASPRPHRVASPWLTLLLPPHPPLDPAPAIPPDAEAAAAARIEHCLLFERMLTERLQARSGMTTTLLMEEDEEVIRLVLSQWESRSGAEWKE
eukprot:1315388-Pleurochrysis_carterae.AAC.1